MKKTILIAGGIVILLGAGVAAYLLVRSPSKDLTGQMWSACTQGDLATAEKLLAGTPGLINAKHGDLTPLATAVIYGGGPKLVEFLLKRGADPNIGDQHGSTPLHRAVYDDSVTLVKLLLSHGADPNAKNDKGQSPTDVAKYYDQKHMMELLMRDPAKSP